MFLFGPIGPTELLIVLLIAIIIFGGKRLGELGKGLGEGIRNFRKGLSSKDQDQKKSENEETHPPDKK